MNDTMLNIKISTVAFCRLVFNVISYRKVDLKQCYHGNGAHVMRTVLMTAAERGGSVWSGPGM